MKCKRFIRVLGVLLALFFASCSSTQKITVKQEQEGQIQETVIESDTKFNALSLYFGSEDTQIGELGVNHYKL